MASGTYNAESITVLEGLEAVRRRPGMYIGGVDKAGLHHLLWEIVDNSVDEVMNGHATRIVVTLDADGKTISVADNGRGIPVDIHPKTGKSALEVIFTTLHAGGKFDNDAYKVAGGLHGVGASVVNALSKSLVAQVRRDGLTYTQRYRRGKPLGPVEPGEPARGTGTTVTFTPDPEIFRDAAYDPKLIAERLEVKTYLNKGLVIQFVDQKEQDERRVPPRRRRRRLPRRRQPGAGRHAGRRLALRARARGQRRGPPLPPRAGLDRGDRRGRPLVRQHDPDPRRRHPRAGDARGRPRGRAAVHDRPRPRQEGDRDQERGHPRGADGRPLGLRPRAAVPGADQGAAEQPRGPVAGRVDGPPAARELPAQEQERRRRDRRAGDPGGQGPRGQPRRRQPGPPQDGDQQPAQPARQAPRLRQHQPRGIRAVHRRGRLGRRLGQAGARPRHPGDPAAQGQGPQRRAGGQGQGARQQGADRHRQRPRLRHGRPVRPGAGSATARSSS